MGNSQVFPTKGNLIATKKSLALAKTGYELMDRKRNILIREMMELLDDVRMLRDQITDTYAQAYLALQKANISMGVISEYTKAVPIDNGIKVSYRSVMGVEIPKIQYVEQTMDIYYGLEHANSTLDYAYECFHKVKVMSVTLAEIDNSVYRLANAIRKTQKRANALKNVVIPDFQNTTKFISDVLEEREREEFSRQKVIKTNKEKLKMLQKQRELEG